MRVSTYSAKFYAEHDSINTDRPVSTMNFKQHADMSMVAHKDDCGPPKLGSCQMTGRMQAQVCVLSLADSQ